jgi:hypothetical protein
MSLGIPANYHTVLKTVRSWPKKAQHSLAEELLAVDAGNEEAVEPPPVYVPSPEELRRLHESVAGSDYAAPRRYSADEATGIAPLKNPSLSLEEEKEALIQALMEKYG